MSMAGDSRPERFRVVWGLVTTPSHMLVRSDNGEVPFIEITRCILNDIKHFEWDTYVFRRYHQSIDSRRGRAQPQHGEPKPELVE